jgi:serine/threonine protein kinase
LSLEIIFEHVLHFSVLLDANGGIKICDFGMAKANSASEELMASVHGTILYMAPEVMREANYDRRVGNLK